MGGYHTVCNAVEHGVVTTGTAVRIDAGEAKNMTAQARRVPGRLKSYLAGWRGFCTDKERRTPVYLRGGCALALRVAEGLGAALREGVSVFVQPAQQSSYTFNLFHNR
ncbi:MAG: hypothetical protein OEX02_19215 [Cyclobacteriaceae bacterium]|nr:hypothetical protein [Cyclobacteriaceae bacterium]